MCQSAADRASSILQLSSRHEIERSDEAYALVALALARGTSDPDVTVRHAVASAAGAMQLSCILSLLLDDEASDVRAAAAHSIAGVARGATAVAAAEASSARGEEWNDLDEARPVQITISPLAKLAIGEACALLRALEHEVPLAAAAAAAATEGDEPGLDALKAWEAVMSRAPFGDCPASVRAAPLSKAMADGSRQLRFAAAAAAARMGDPILIADVSLIDENIELRLQAALAPPLAIIPNQTKP